MEFTIKLGLFSLCWLGLVYLTSAQGTTPAVAIIPNERNVRKFINDSYFVSCQPRPEGTKAEWYNPKNIRIDGNPLNRIRVETSFGIDLFLTRITSGDAGTYTCATSKARTSFTLHVLRPITFDQNLAEQSASEGRNHTMRCQAQSHGNARIYWRVDNKAPSGKFKILRDNSLLIQNVTAEDGRRSYVCRAMDMDSPVPQTSVMNITLKVRMKPRLVQGARTEHWGVLGEWANLTCAVTAEPAATFEWIHRGAIIRQNDESIVVHPQENIAILQVLVRSESRFGDYTCRASNNEGKMDKKMFLHRGQKPPTPILETDVVAGDGARIRVKEYRKAEVVDPDRERSKAKPGRALPITGFMVQFKMMTRSDWKMANASKYDEGFIIKGLSPGITYQVRAAARNQASVGEYSPPITVITSKSTSWSISATTSSLLVVNSVWTILNLLILSAVALII